VRKIDSLAGSKKVVPNHVNGNIAHFFKTIIKMLNFFSLFPVFLSGDEATYFCNLLSFAGSTPSQSAQRL